MQKLTIKRNPSVDEKFRDYPAAVRDKLWHLRSLIIETAREDPSINELEETLKWGEPSYLSKKGSTVRINWKSSNPDQYAIYFKCTSKLVPTFKKVYGDLFTYEKNRAILFSLVDKIPEAELKECIGLALNYQTIKKLPRLGM